MRNLKPLSSSFLLVTLLGSSTSGCAGPAIDSEATAATSAAAKSTPMTEAAVAEAWKNVDLAYAHGHLGVHQSIVSTLQAESVDLGPTQLEQRIGAVLARPSQDGLEGLLLTYFDALQLVAKDRATTLRTGLVTKLRFAAKARPWWTVRLARHGTTFQIEVRGDAARALLEGLANGGPTDLLALITAKGARQRMCDLPVIRDDLGAIPPAEIERAKNCNSTGTAGTPGPSGVATTLGGLETGACFGGKASDQHWLDQAIADMDACFADDPSAARLSAHTPAMGPATFCVMAPNVCVAIVTGVATVLTGAITGGVAWHNANVDAETKQKNEAVRVAADVETQMRAAFEAASNAVQTAKSGVSTAEANLKTASSGVSTAEDALSSAKTPAEVSAAEAALKAAKETETKAKNELDAAKKTLVELEKEKNAKAAALEAATKARQQVQKDAVGPSGLPGASSSSDACRRLALGGVDISNPAVLRKLGDDWKSLDARYKNKAMPNPDATADAWLDHGGCGLGQSSGVSTKCKSVMLCGNGRLPDDACRCNGASHSEPAGNGCFLQNCADGSLPVSSGKLCFCAPTESVYSDKKPPTPPKPMVVANLFEGMPSTSGRPMSTFIGNLTLKPMSYGP